LFHFSLLLNIFIESAALLHSLFDSTENESGEKQSESGEIQSESGE